MVAVPDFTGKSFEEASAALSQLGFTPVDGGEVDSSVPQGRVASTSPAGGSEAGLGSSVTIYRSNGQAQVIPDVTGYDLKSAQSELGKAGFETSSSCSAGDKKPDGKSKVVSTDPVAGTELRIGSNVAITVDCG